MKKIIAAMAVLFMLGISTGMTYAYLFAEKDVKNEISAANTEIEIVEEFDPPEEIKPGREINKTVKVTSHSDRECYVRVMIHFSDQEAQNFCEPLEISDRWKEGGDGYYYWQEKLFPEETTEPLIRKIKIRDDASMEQLHEFEVLVYAEAVSAENVSMEEAWKLMDQKPAAKTEKEE